jgi:hypothetical protein
MSGHGKDAVRLCEHVVRQAFGGVVTVSVEVFDLETTSSSRSKLGPAPQLAALLALQTRSTVSSGLVRHFFALTMTDALPACRFDPPEPRPTPFPVHRPPRRAAQTDRSSRATPSDAAQPRALQWRPPPHRPRGSRGDVRVRGTRLSPQVALGQDARDDPGEAGERRHGGGQDGYGSWETHAGGCDAGDECRRRRSE